MAKSTVRRGWRWTDAASTFSKSLLLLALVAIRVAKDVGIAGLLLWGLFAVQAIRDRLPIKGWAATWILDFHQWATLISYLIFAVLLVWDMIEVHKGPPE